MKLIRIFIYVLIYISALILGFSIGELITSTPRKIIVSNPPTVIEESNNLSNYMLNGSVFVRGIEGLGSGTVIKKTATEMYVLTCYHVIDDIVAAQKNKLSVSPQVGYVRDDIEGNSRGEVVYAAEIIKIDPENDLALLKTFFSDDTLNEIKLAEIAPSIGDIIYSVGNPLGVMRTLSKGILANHKEGFYICDNTTTYGNSGGTLYNDRGEQIGVPSNVMGYPLGNNEFVPESGLGLSIDLFRIREFLKDVL